MNNDGKIAFQLTLLLAVGLMSCTSSKTMARTEAMTELQQMQSAVRDMDIVVSAGVTKDEYSKRLTDALLKFGDRDHGCKQTVAKFPDGQQQSAAAEVCTHLTSAMDAYTYAKLFVGPEPEGYTATVAVEDYADAKERFPNLEELSAVDTQGGYKWYRRGDMVQGLWNVADQEFQLAETAIAKLTQT